MKQLREMVILPLQYPEVFKHLAITPPRCDQQLILKHLSGATPQDVWEGTTYKRA